ncbi:hypothetical protein KR038_010395, partial [Drosophila bunnanda]
GSAFHGVRMYDNDEYDVMIELEFRNYMQILVRPDQHRPGMVHLCFKQLDCNHLMEDTLLDHRWYLKHEEIRDVIYSILNDNHDRLVRNGNMDAYRLHCEPRGTCFTITATSVNRQFSIDFVPAIKVRFVGVDLQVVPKSVPGPKRSSGCTFQVQNIRDELYLFEGGGVMIQQAVMLLKALCESKNLRKIRFYHLVSLTLWLMDRDDIKEYSLEYIFLNLLYDLCEALEDNSLPYYLYEELDLISDFKPHELTEYAAVLKKAYMTLKTYPYQENLSYERCSWHFF